MATGSVCSQDHDRGAMVKSVRSSGYAADSPAGKWRADKSYSLPRCSLSLPLVRQNKKIRTLADAIANLRGHVCRGPELPFDYTPSLPWRKARDSFSKGRVIHSAGQLHRARAGGRSFVQPGAPGRVWPGPSQEGRVLRSTSNALLAVICARLTADAAR
jgi:hypothetical protein